MTLYADETFGPVVAARRVGSVDEAIALANDSRFGLNFAVWTRDPARGRAVAARLHAGTVNVNDAYGAAWASVDAPMGGMKDSGVGRRHGEHGILKYTEPQTIASQHLLPIAPPRVVGARRYAVGMTAALRAMQRVPWLK
jgi:succinate-semialdehyde dehydrogenase/glutarate-semialdehyde dehydrogenase